MQTIAMIVIGLFIICIIRAIKTNKNRKTYEVKGEAIRMLDLKKIYEDD